MKTLTENFNFQLRTFVLTAEESLLKKKKLIPSSMVCFRRFFVFTSVVSSSRSFSENSMCKHNEK